jgi:hypothetical protein
MRRRGFLHAAVGTLLAFLGIGRADAQESPRATSGGAATWQYRWHDGLSTRHPVPRPNSVPTDFVPAGDHQKHKTQHWVRPLDWPLGPAVQSQNGEIISVDYMIAKADFERGFSWSLVYPPGLRHLKVDHIDIDLVPAGHTGFETPHYDIHVYFVNHGAHGACEM